MVTNLAHLVPSSLRPTFRFFGNAVTGLFFRGSKRHCPVCGKSSRKFTSYGRIPREDARCPRCGSLERHRLLWLFVERCTDLLDHHAKRMLHIAPEPVLTRRFKRATGTGYLTADLNDTEAMVRMDICDIDYPSESFDVIYCSHVLEHVEHDRQAMREIHRVLSRDGWAILLVPIVAEKTFEDPSVIDPKERERLFGQWDHVRAYGPDYVDRLADAGFTVAATRPTDFLSPEEIRNMGITKDAGDIFFCTKA